jgi:hypothetical protein
MLAQMGDDRAVEPFFKATGDADAEVADTALQALGKRKEAVRPLVEAALRDTHHFQRKSSGLQVEPSLSEMDRRRWTPALRYLIAYPDASRESLIEPLFRIVADANTNIEIAQMAVQVLGQMPGAVRPVVEAALQGTDHRRWKSAFRYLAMQSQDLLGKEIPGLEEGLGSEMVYVPPGPFGWEAMRKVIPLQMTMGFPDIR